MVKEHVRISNIVIGRGQKPDLGEVLPFWHGLDTNPLNRTVMEGFLKQQLP